MDGTILDMIEAPWISTNSILEARSTMLERLDTTRITPENSCAERWATDTGPYGIHKVIQAPELKPEPAGRTQEPG